MSPPCPRCAQPLHTEWIAKPDGEGDVPAKLCTACSGVWLSAEALPVVCPTLAHLPARRMEVRLTGAPSPALRCPVCNAQPWETTVLDVVVDLCLDCGGVWLDAGEYSDENATEPTRAAPKAAYRSVQSAGAGPPRCTYCQVVVDESRAFVREHGVACPACHYAREQRVAALRAERGPLERFLQRAVELMTEQD